jgi:hypothetical protein
LLVREPLFNIAQLAARAGIEQGSSRLDLFGSDVIAAIAAKHPDFRMLLNARQLAHELHRRVAMLAGGSRVAGRRHESQIRFLRRENNRDAAPVSAPELVKIVHPARSISGTGSGAQ